MGFKTLINKKDSAIWIIHRGDEHGEGLDLVKLPDGAIDGRHGHTQRQDLAATPSSELDILL